MRQGPLIRGTEGLIEARPFPPLRAQVEEGGRRDSRHGLGLRLGLGLTAPPGPGAVAAGAAPVRARRVCRRRQPPPDARRRGLRSRGHSRRRCDDARATTPQKETDALAVIGRALPREFRLCVVLRGCGLVLPRFFVFCGFCGRRGVYLVERGSRESPPVFLRHVRRRRRRGRGPSAPQRQQLK